MFSPPRATAQFCRGFWARFRYSYRKNLSISTTTRLSPVAVKYCFRAFSATISGQ